MTCSITGGVSKSEIVGAVKANSKLSGMPLVELSFNNHSILERMGGHDQMGIEFNDIKFHKCIDMQFYQSTNKIVFTPPDGEFELLTYYIRPKVKALFDVNIETVHSSQAKGSYKLRISANFKNNSSANDVVVHIPVPCDLVKPKFKCPEGKMDYLADKNCFSWTIDSFAGDEVFDCEYEYSLPSLASRRLKSQSQRLPKCPTEDRLPDSLLHYLRTKCSLL